MNKSKPTIDPAKRSEYNRRFRLKHGEEFRKSCREYQREWRRLHPGYYREGMKAWSKKNGALYAREWRKRHPAKPRPRGDRKAYSHAYYLKNRTKILEYVKSPKGKKHCQARRARKRNAAGFHTADQWIQRFLFHGQRCRYCRIPLTLQQASIDHAIPLSRGGSNWPSNLVPACLPCNCSKHNKTISEFLRH